MEVYTRNDKIHALYCNNNDNFYQGWVSELKQLSNAVSENETNPIPYKQYRLTNKTI